ncbi:MAG: VWA domain-containing protein [Myxococcales bacterium]|nr:VWA domain-containing protein [Myxococcales bacterium]
MGLCYRTSRWLDRLWSEHLELSEPARDLVKQGIRKQGERFTGFPADLHARLYLPTDPTDTCDAPDWATRLHALASELAEWKRLRLMCSRNGFAAGIATEVLLEQLLPHVPDRPRRDSSAQHGGDTPTTNKDAPSKPESSTKPTESSVRAAIRCAARKARDAVHSAEASLEGVSGALALPMAGKQTARPTGPADLKAIREAHQRLSKSRRLRRISELAGRLERAALCKARSKVRPGVGEIHGIGFGRDVGQLLPSELVMLRRPRLRLALLARLVEGRALSYAMRGREPLARGPVIVLLDESASMRSNDKDIWSKAVALALLSTATRQRRSWSLVAFNGSIIREHTISAGRATASDIEAALNHRCSGGTDFDAPICRGIELIKSSRVLRQADIVIITDGQDELEPDTIERAQRFTKSEGVSFYAVGVGDDAAESILSLASIATSTVAVRDTNDTAELVAPVLVLERPDTSR